MNLYEQLRQIALNKTVDKTEDYLYRKVCRWFSEKFHTPLPTVESLPMPYVLEHYFECVLDPSTSEEGEDDLQEEIMRAIDPDYDKEEEEDLMEFISLIEQEAKGERKPPKLKKNLRQDLKKVASKSLKDKGDRQSSDKARGPVRRTYSEDIPSEADGEGLEDLDGVLGQAAGDKGKGRP